MLKFSKKVEYALISLLHLDRGDGLRVEASKAIADHHNIPADLLGKVLQALTRFSLIEAVHGAKGGYRLTKSLEHITVGQVIDAIDGPITLTRCESGPDKCDQYCNCNIRDPIQKVQVRLDSFMKDIPLSTFRDENVPIRSGIGTNHSTPDPI